ncbi:MAG: glycosyltransferase family 4 protein [Planctomycetota bacterium]|nr:glycosyltransferase family 4 protein [Planctomycetota bacterium]
MIPTMMRVLHIIDTATAAEALAQLSLLAGADDVVASAGVAPRYRGLGPQIKQVHRPLGSAVLCGRRMRSLAGRVDLIHTWSLDATRAGCLAGRQTGRKPLVSIPNLPPKNTLSDMVKSLSRGRFHVGVPMQVARRALLGRGAPDEAVHVLPPAAELIDNKDERRLRTRRHLGLSDAERLIVAPAEMTPAAGHKIASWVHGILRQILSDVRLLLPGGGPARAGVKSFAATTGYDGDVFLTEDRIDLADALAAADVAVFLQRRDCGVSTLAAAMAAGLPIVCSATPEATQCVADGRAALLVPPGNPHAAATAVLRLLEEPDLAKRLGRAAQQQAQRFFSPDACRRKLHRIYAVLTAGLTDKTDAPDH